VNLRERMENLSPSTAVLTSKSKGGAMSAESAYQMPVDTLLPGPASGVIGALRIARQVRLESHRSRHGGERARISASSGMINKTTSWMCEG
jgi:hypothetical protein